MQKFKLFLAYFFALFFMGAGIFFAYGAWDCHKKNEMARHAEPARLSVDLSKTGSYKGPYEQTYTHTHDQVLVFEFEPSFETEKQCEAAVEGLSGRVTIDDAEGEIVRDISFKSNDVFWRRVRSEDFEPTLNLGFPFDIGQYTITLTVEQPAEKLSGIAQQAVVIYFLCGLEGLQGMIEITIAGICFIIGFPLTTVAYELNKKYRTTVSDINNE